MSFNDSSTGPAQAEQQHIAKHYLYSVGGRIRFEESAAEAIVREAFEEGGVKLEVDRHKIKKNHYEHPGMLRNGFNL